MAQASTCCHRRFCGEEKNVTVKVLLFAGARELAGTSEGSLTNVPLSCTHDELLNRVVMEFGLQKMSCCIALALNQNYIQKEDIVTLCNGDELAVIPPLSGG